MSGGARSLSSEETLVVVVNVFVAVEVEGKARMAFRESIVLRFLEIIILRIESRSSVDSTRTFNDPENILNI